MNLAFCPILPKEENPSKLHTSCSGIFYCLRPGKQEEPINEHAI